MRNLKNLTLVSMLIASAGLGAQESVGTIVGTVRDASGAAVAGASIRITGHNLLTAREATTDANGRYRVQLLLPGQCTVMANKQGYIGSRRAFMVSAGSILTADFVLKTVATQVEEIDVVGNADPILDKTQTKIATTFNMDTLYSLPTNLDASRAALYFAPGVSDSTNYARIRGNTSGQAAYTLNGVSMRDASVGEGRVSDFSMDDMVQDVQVTQNPINAKFGFSSSGSVNVVTKTGTNKFEGTFRVALSNSAWRTYNDGPVNNRWSEKLSTSTGTEFWYAAPDNPAADILGRTYNVTLMGPIWRDRVTFAYGSVITPKSPGRFQLYNPLSTNQEQNNLYLPGLLAKGSPGNRTQGPNPTAAGNPMADNWGANYWAFNPMRPGDPMYVTGENKNHFDMFKLFFQITPEHQVEVNYTTSGYTNFGQNLPANRIDPDVKFNQVGDRSYKSVSYRGIIGSSGVLSATWGERKSHIIFPSGPGDPIYITYYDRSVGGLLDRSGSRTSVHSGGGNSSPGDRNNLTWNLDYNHVWGSHDIDVGVQRMTETVRSDGQGGMNNRTFYSPGMRYDGKYMVYNIFADDSPYMVTDANEFANLFTLVSGETMAARKNTIISSRWMPYLVKYSGSALADYKPYENTTTSFYVNDNWTLNDHWAFNVGIRADKSVSTDTFEPISGPLADCLTVSPRLRVQYDLFGDNRHVFNLAITQSVGSLNQANMGVGFTHSAPDLTTRTYFWNRGSSQPTFVDKGDILTESNYGYYYSYADTGAYYLVDPNLKPETTQQIDLQYKRVFDNGGFFSMSLNANRALNLLLYTIKDDVFYIKDPSGKDPVLGGGGNVYPRWLSNQPDRGRHYAGAEMQWNMPLVSKPTYKMNWSGNWTIAKTTGNWVQNATGNYNNAEAYTARHFEYAVERLGIDAKYFDPWGEISGTPRHSVNMWLTFVHGERGGVRNELRLASRWDDGGWTTQSWTINYPDNLFNMSNPTLFPNGTAIPPGNVAIYPYGRSHRRGAGHTYNTNLQWNFTIPIRGSLHVFGALAITNVFNSTYDGQGYNSFSLPQARTWARVGQGGTFENQPELAQWLGKAFGTLANGSSYGVYSPAGIRGFNTNVEFGFRF
jgi:hypothetical protein